MKNELLQCSCNWDLGESCNICEFAPFSVTDVVIKFVIFVEAPARVIKNIIVVVMELVIKI
jgi:hypothetical protein